MTHHHKMGPSLRAAAGGAREGAACAGGDSRNTGDGGDTGAAALHVVPDSGHNVHIDAPDDLLELMGPTFELQR